MFDFLSYSGEGMMGANILDFWNVVWGWARCQSCHTWVL